MTVDAKALILSCLRRVAGEMVRCEGMPPEFLDDWRLPKTTPKAVRQEIAGRSLAARSKAIAWARSLRTAIELLDDK